MRRLRLDRGRNMPLPNALRAGGAEQRDRQERESDESDQRPHGNRRRVQEQLVLAKRVDPLPNEGPYRSGGTRRSDRYSVSRGSAGSGSSVDPGSSVASGFSPRGSTSSVGAGASASSTASRSPSLGGAAAASSARSCASIASSSSSLGSSPPSGTTSVFTSTRTSWKSSIGTS